MFEHVVNRFDMDFFNRMWIRNGFDEESKGNDSCFIESISSLHSCRDEEIS